MKLIKDISCMIEEEICDAEQYAREAVLEKDQHPALARTYHQLAEDELGHADRLHTQVVSLIDEHKRNNGAPPEAMQAVYDYLHERQIEKVARVKVMLAEFKG